MAIDKSRLSTPQCQRLDRARQGFDPIAVCEDLDDRFEMVLHGASGSPYVLQNDSYGLTCSCPDSANVGPMGLLCKHLCWLLVEKGGAETEALLGDMHLIESAIATAWRAIKDEMQASNQQYEAIPEKCSEDCPICMEVLGEPTECKKCRACSNHFHTTCLIKCMQVNKACPMCRNATAWDGMGWTYSLATLRLA